VRNLLYFLALAYLPLATAQDAGYCGLNAPQPDEFIPSNEVSGNYWTNMLDDDTVMFTADGGVSGEYQAYNLKERKAYKLTNEIDPFPVPDARRVYVHPGPIQFFEFDEIAKRVENGEDQGELVEIAGKSPRRDRKARIKHEKRKERDNYEEKEGEPGMPYKDYELGDRDGMMWGYYQSVGVLESKKSGMQNYSKYRILTGEEEGTFKDYKVSFGKDGRIKKVSSENRAKVMCNNWRKEDKVDLDFDTPILSPKGDEFAITDRETGTTKIIKFNPRNGDCSVAMDLGFEAGKVHFSPDGSKLAFHTQNLKTGITDSTTPNNRGYLLDRKNNTIVSLKVGEHDEATSEQYPVFLSDGRILYQRVKFDPATGKQSRAWVKVDPEKLNKAHYSKVTEEDCSQDKNLPLIAIGKLYSEICGTVSLDDSLMWTLNMDPEKCKSLVEKEWNEEKSKVISQLNHGAKDKIPENYLSKEMLISACPTKKVGEIKIIKEDEGVKMKYPPVVGERCVVCHVQGSPRGYIPFDKPEEMRNMKAFGLSAAKGGPYEGKTFLEQMEGILENNVQGKTPPVGVPRVPADGPRLKREQVDVILDWVKNGKEVKE
jgi:hypothetical protein